MTTAAPEVSLPGRDKYSVNGLTYTKMGLVAVFFWLLFGSFIFNIMEMVKPRLLPLLLMGNAGQIGASMSVSNLMTLIIPGITGILIGPAVSFRSDRYRGKRGRRIPFITWTMPPLVIALIGIGMAPYYRDAFAAWGGVLTLSPKTATLLVIGFFVVMFHVFDEFVNSVFWYLFADVVPEAFIGRFVALSNMVGGGATFAFNWWMFPHAEKHMEWIFTGAALAYLIGFSIMCWKVKEGTYPPPDDIGENPSIFKQIKIYMVECFSYRIYNYTFLFTACLFFAMGANGGMIIFQRDGINLSMEFIGKVGAIISLVGMGLAYPSGWAVDKWHPLRISLIMIIPLIATQFLTFFFLTDQMSYIVLGGVGLVFTSLFNAASIPMLITLFPKDKYGQYCSCNGLVKSMAMMLGGACAGIFMDHMTNSSADKFSFRYAYVWIGLCQAAAMFFLGLVYLQWKKRGGSASYVPPGSALEKEMLARAAGEPAPISVTAAQEQNSQA